MTWPQRSFYPPRLLEKLSWSLSSGLRHIGLNYLVTKSLKFVQPNLIVPIIQPIQSNVEDLEKSGDVVMVSYGGRDIVVLDENLRRHGLTCRLNAAVFKYVDFRMYLQKEFGTKISGLSKDIRSVGLQDLVKKISSISGTIRFHNALDDCIALKKVCMKFHQKRRIGEREYSEWLTKTRRTTVDSIPLAGDGQLVRTLAQVLNLNPTSQPWTLLDKMDGAYSRIKKSQYFTIRMDGAYLHFYSSLHPKLWELSLIHI